MNLKFGLFILAFSFNLFGKTVQPLSESNKIIFGSVSKKPHIHKSITYDVTMNKDEVLKKGHLFLMTVAGISTGPAPTGNAFASKIIYFERRGDRLSMFESTEGKMVTTSLSTRKYLTEFPILSETENFITIDFAKGMNSLIVKDGMYSSDGGSSTETILITTSSFIDKVEIRDKFLFIDQFIQYQIPGTRDFGDYNLKFSFSSYEENKNFKPRKSIGFKNLGYFESHPQFDPNAGPDDESSFTNILRYSLEKPITYYLSKNVPPEFKQAVIDGVLYWNKVYGRDIVMVDQLPEGVSVHEPGYNIVQWLDWDSAGYAYADIQSNPVTGEILQSHVYMTSSFAKSGIRSATDYLRKLLTMVTPNSNPTTIGLKGFKSARTCNISLENFVGTDIAKIQKILMEKSEGEATKIINRFASDYVRAVVAHEVGHTLGLRHNFAASQDTNIPNEDYAKISDLNFLTGLMPDGLYPSTSVMDYTQIYTSGMIGSIIRNKSAALPYDKMAIEWGYSTDNQPVNPDTLLFCTDSSNGEFIDCRVWDQMSNPVLFANSKWKDAPNTLAFWLFLDLEKGLKSDKDIKTIIKSLRLAPEKNASWMVSKFMDLLFQATPESKYLKILNKYPDLSTLNQEEYLQDIRSFQESSFNSIGGLTQNVFKDVTPKENLQVPVVKNLSNQFFAYLDKLTLDEEKKNQITLSYKAFFSNFEKEFLLQFSQEMQKLTFNISAEKWLENLMNFGEITLFSNSEKVLTTFGEKKILIPVFEYKRNGQNLRSQIVRLIGTDFFPQIPSYQRNRDKIGNKMASIFVTYSDSIIGETPKNELPDPVYDWFASEVNTFLPIMPRSLQIKYLQEMSNL